MRIVAICGSYRKQGNTAKTLRRVLEGAASNGAETEIVYLGDYDLKPCRGCKVCEKTDVCVIKDDDGPKILEAIRRADALVVGAPTYIGGITGMLKQYIDRCYPFMKIVKYDAETGEYAFGSVFEKTRPGILVAISGGMGPEVLEGHRRIVNYHFNDLNMYIQNEVLVPYTSSKPVDENHPVWEEAYEAGAQLVDSVLAGNHPKVLNEV